MCTPITYMQWIDGRAYGVRGLSGLYATEGGLDLLACGLMTLLFLLVWRRPAAAAMPQPVPATSAITLSREGRAAAGEV